MPEVTEKIKILINMITTTISQPLLLELLSECLAVEKGGKILYQTALGLVRDHEVLRHFQKFYEQTVRHEEILTRVIDKLGGSPQHMSAGAKLAEKKAHALFDTMIHTDGLEPAKIEINAMENIVLAEPRTTPIGNC